MKSILFGLFLVLGSLLHAQSQNEVLTEEYFLHRNPYLDIRFDCYDLDAKTYYSACYLGNKGNVRRIEEYWSFPEDYSYKLCIYNDEGDLQRFSAAYGCPGYAFFGTAFRSVEGTESVVKYEFTLRYYYNENDGNNNTYRRGSCTQFSDLLTLVNFKNLTPDGASKDFNFSEYLTTKSLAKTDLHNVDNLCKSKGQARRKVVIKRPKIGDVSFVTANDVNVRAQASMDAEKVAKAQVGNMVVVRDVIIKDGGEVWYEVEGIDNSLDNDKGKLYIYGAYLDDTAHPIEATSKQ